MFSKPQLYSLTGHECIVVWSNITSPLNLQSDHVIKNYSEKQKNNFTIKTYELNICMAVKKDH